MALHLVPKPKSRNPAQLRMRLAMLANGWTPIPCEGKGIMSKGWPKVTVTEQQLYEWDGYGPGGSKLKGTGIRLEGDILVLDLDISDVELMNEVLDALEKMFPEWMYGALWRHSGGVTWALFARISKPIGSLPHRNYGIVSDDGTITNKAHCEIHGGLSKRYFASAGPHRDPARQYGYDGKGPDEVRLDSLPVLPFEQAGAMLDCVEGVLGKHLTVIDERPDKAASSVWDLTPDMKFRLASGDGDVLLGDLDDMLEAGTANGVYGTLEFDWGHSESGTRHHAFVRDTNNRLMVTDHYRSVNHYWADEKPPESVLDEEALAALRELAVGADEAHAPPLDGEILPPRSMRIEDIERDADPKVSYARAAAWLITHVAFYPQAFGGRGGAVSIYPDGEFQTPVSIAALKGALSTFSYETKGGRGGVKRHNPVDLWALRPEQVRVFGVRMRPELARPLFREDGLLLINRYYPPGHPREGGTIAPFLAYLERLIPNPAERAWVFNWFALLVQQPHWRMIALVMVAREMGSGRGLLVECMQYVLGVRFVISIPYAKLSGGAGSRFNAEVVDRLLVCVNEARDGDDRKFSNKNASREALKDFLEPNHRVPFRVEPKGVDAYFTQAAMSAWINSNNVDALPLGEGDRRAAVVECGPKASVEERETFQAWMLKPENIGALWRALRDHTVEQDKTIFDPYDAPLFRGRDLMIDAGKTSVDRAWEAAIEKLATASDLYTQTQIVTLTRHYYQGHGLDIDELVKTHNRVKGHRIGVKRPKEINWRIRYGEGEDNREPVYAVKESDVMRWTHASSVVIHEQLDKAQKAVDAPAKAFNKLLHGVETGGGEQ